MVISPRLRVYWLNLKLAAQPALQLAMPWLVQLFFAMRSNAFGREW